MFLKQILIVLFNLFVASNAQVLKFSKLKNNETKLFTLSRSNDTNTRRLFSNRHPDLGLTVPELIMKNGYPIETHIITTRDSYKLSVHRIPHGKKNKHWKNKRVIFLMHGILASSSDWVIMGPKRGLAYLLADMGYDVWMGNARGNIYSKAHSYLSPEKDASEFWNFSWHEIGIYDLTAMIDYILTKTFKQSLYYVGHSQGCTTFLVMTSMFPHYNDKIRVMIALAPAVFMANAASPIIRYAAEFIDVTKILINLLGKNEFMPQSKFMKQIAGALCDRQSILQGICKNVLFLLSGFDEFQLDRERLPIILSNTPAGSSTKQILHFIQNARSSLNLFRQYDHGFFKNILKYSSIRPPEYNLKNVTAPVAIFASYNDLYVDVKDIDKLYEELPRAILNYRVPLKTFTHLDFLWAIDVIPLVYKEIFKQLQMY